MASYRVYFLGAQRRIFAAENIEAADDESAIETARQRAGALSYAAFEVWRGANRIYRHPPESPPPKDKA